MSTDIPKTAFRRMLRWSMWTAGSLLLAGVLAFAYVTFVGITVDASLLRGRIAAVFSETLGRTVRFDGPMELEISARPKLRLSIACNGSARGIRKPLTPPPAMRFAACST